MTNFEKVAATPEALGAFLASLPVASGPWDEEFQRRCCSGCEREDCDGGSRCPHEEKRNSPLWWLGLEEADERQGTERIVVASMKREYYETGVAVMGALAKAMWTKEKCRVMVDYDPAEEILKVYKEFNQSP